MGHISGYCILCPNFRDPVRCPFDSTSRYNQDDLVGEGSFGSVFKATWVSAVVALKKLRVQELSRFQLRAFTTEIKVLASARHPHVVQFLGACVERPNLGIVTGGHFLFLASRKLAPRVGFRVAYHWKYLHLKSQLSAACGQTWLAYAYRSEKAAHKRVAHDHEIKLHD